MKRRRQNQLTRKASPKACHCSALQSGTYRHYELPDTALATLAGDANIHDHWENIRKCSVCGQYWHQATICGHANVETFKKISSDERAALLAEIEKKSQPSE